METIFLVLSLLICAGILLVPFIDWNRRVRKQSGKILLYKGLGIEIETEFDTSANLTFVSNQPFMITETYTLYEAIEQNAGEYKYSLEITTDRRHQYYVMYCKHGLCRLVYNQKGYALWRKLSTRLSANLYIYSILFGITALLVYLELYHRFA